MKAFNYEGREYIRAIPGKSLFRSSMVHEVVNRGDIFALRTDDQILTVVPGRAEVEHVELNTLRAEEAKKRLAFAREELIVSIYKETLKTRAASMHVRGAISFVELRVINSFLDKADK